MEVGLGQLGLSPDEFWQMTPLEFLCAQKGFFELYRTKEKADWHRTIELINIQLPPVRRINPESLFNVPKRRNITMEQRKREVEKFLKKKL